MKTDDLKFVRDEFILSCLDEDRFIPEQSVLENSLQYMLDAKIIETEEYSKSYIADPYEKIKINGFQVNESGERLQVFIVDENHISDGNLDEHICTQRAEYQLQFNRGLKAVKLALNGKFMDKQLSDPIGLFSNIFQREKAFEEIDVVEVILITLTATCSNYQGEISPKSMYFPDENIKITNGSSEKELLVVNTIIDLNFIHEIINSRGNSLPLVVNFKKTFGRDIKVIEAASDKNFSTYLCALDADIIADLYKRYSTRLLDRNVRSFLQFKGKNRGMRDTIREQPERFIAYNNGLTITATDVSIDKKKEICHINELTDFQIVNGGQTTASIYFSKKDGLDVSKVTIMAKINVVKNQKESEVDDLISNISKFSNTQTNVSSIDLRSRSKELVQLKQLSNSVVTPSGKKWFFERSRGEYATALRMAGSSGAARLKRETPKERQFTKDQLAKVFLSWGNEPWFVKKGGEKIFRRFMEMISNTSDSEPTIAINRDFYELLIGKMILVTALTKIYGAGKNSMGQLRSAAVPYSMSLLYRYTDGNNKTLNFLKLWKSEKLPVDLNDFCTHLLELTNSLLKQYSKSDDIPQYSKNKELWDDIKSSQEVDLFFSQVAVKNLLDKYSC
jgi:hypothetical protein